MQREQDKNRDVIVAFPDVDPSLITTIPHESEKPMIKQFSDSSEQPHLWYSTSEVIHALELFLEGGDQLQESNTYG